MNQSIEQSCLKFREIKFFVEEKSNGLGVVYVSTGEGEFLANVDMNTGINWNFCKKNVNKPLMRFNGMIFLHSQLLSQYESGREIDKTVLDTKLNQIKLKLLRLYSNRLIGRASKSISIEPTFIKDLQGKYAEIAHDMSVRNAAKYTYIKTPSDDAIKNRLVYIGGVYDPKLDLYRVIGFMGNYYNLSAYEVVQRKQGKGVK